MDVKTAVNHTNKTVILDKSQKKRKKYTPKKHQQQKQYPFSKFNTNKTEKSVPLHL